MDVHVGDRVMQVAQIGLSDTRLDGYHTVVGEVGEEKILLAKEGIEPLKDEKGDPKPWPAKSFQVVR